MKDFLRLLFVSGAARRVSGPLSLSGQTTNGNIQGTVVDPSGAAVPGAAVTARNVDHRRDRRGDTTGAGVYALSNLPPGPLRGHSRDQQA